MSSRLSSLLVQAGVITVRALEDALIVQAIKGGQLDTILLERHQIKEKALLTALSQVCGFPPAHAQLLLDISPEAAQLLPLAEAEKLEVCPLKQRDGKWIFLVGETKDQLAIRDLAKQLGQTISPYVTTEARLHEARHLVYGAPLAERFQKLTQKLGPLPENKDWVFVAETADIRAQTVPLTIGPQHQEAPTSTTYTNPDLAAEAAEAISAVEAAEDATVPEAAPEDLPEAAQSHQIIDESALRASWESQRRDQARTERISVAKFEDIPPIIDEGPQIALSLEDARDLMNSANDRRQILRAMSRAAHLHLELVQIYVVEENLLRGYIEILSPKQIDEQLITKIKLPLNETSIISRSIQTGDIYIGPIPTTDQSARLCKKAGIVKVRNVALVPVMIKNKPICLLIGHCHGAPLAPAMRRFRTSLAEATTEAMLALVLKLKREKSSSGLERSEPNATPVLMPPVASAATETKPTTTSSINFATAPTPELVHMLYPPAGMPPAQDEQSQITEPRRIRGVTERQPFVLSRPGENSFEQPQKISLSQLRDHLAVPTDGFPFDSANPPPTSTKRYPQSKGSASNETPEISRPESRYGEVTLTGRSPAVLLAEIESGADSDQSAEKELLSLGRRAIATLLEAFPGQLKYARPSSLRALPPAHDWSVVMNLLTKLGRPILSVVAPLLQHKEEEIRFYAAYLLSEFPYPEAVVLLAPRLRDPEPAVCAVAKLVLKHFRQLPRFSEIVEALRHDLQNPDPRPVRAAIEGLASLGDGESIPQLIRLINDNDDNVAEAAVRALITLTRQNFDRVENRWQMWWEANRNRNRVEWLIDALLHISLSLRMAAAADLEEITGLTMGYSEQMSLEDWEKMQRQLAAWWRKSNRIA